MNARAYERATQNAGALVCPRCSVGSPLVPLVYEGEIANVVAERVRAFKREHTHEGSEIRIVLPLPSSGLRNRRSRKPEPAVGE